MVTLLLVVVETIRDGVMLVKEKAETGLERVQKRGGAVCASHLQDIDGVCANDGERARTSIQLYRHSTPDPL